MIYLQLKKGFLNGLNNKKDAKKMENLKSKVVALAVAMTTAFVYLVCLVFVALFPIETMATFGNYFVHGMDISSIAAKDIKLSESIIGLVIVTLSAYIVGYVFALIYNWLGQKLKQ